MKLPLHLIFPSFLLAASACASPPLETSTNTGEAAGKGKELVGDRELATKFVLLDIQGETRDGRLCVHFDLKNTTFDDLAIEWAVQWKDASGFDIDIPRWTPATVSGQGLHSIQIVGPTPQAAVFQLQFRKPTPR